MCSHGSYVVGLVCVSALVLIYKHRPVLKQAQGMDGEILSNRTKQFPLSSELDSALATYGIPIMCSHLMKEIPYCTSARRVCKKTKFHSTSGR